MRSRLGGLLAFALILTGAASACSTAGVSYVYMAIDAAGAQHRQIFYTDSSNIFCIAKVSSGRADVTIDFTLEQNAVCPWCEGKTCVNPGDFDSNPNDIHKIFGVTESTPGVGVENVVSALYSVSGESSALPCNGIREQNLPSTNICSGGGNPQAEISAVCPPTYESLGADSAGPGYTCCENLVATAPAQEGRSVLPYPAGEYTCVVSLDGVVAGSTSFTIIYPPANELGNSCPTPPPTQNVPCYNWVPKGFSCVGYQPNTLCNCGESGLWDCTNGS